MPARDPRIEAYIARSADFAKPILAHLREVIHEACPQVEETIKWGFPHFEYHGILCGMGAFRQHCTFGFWKGSLFVKDGRKADAMGQFGQIRQLSDLPSKRILSGYVRQAMKLNEEKVKSPTGSRSRARKPEVEVPDYFRSALRRNMKAQAVFDAFSPSHRRAYVEWITEAKTEPTRQKRIASAIEWMSEGKSRNWKYER
jgi:hypothetical protein